MSYSNSLKTNIIASSLRVSYYLVFSVLVLLFFYGDSPTFKPTQVGAVCVCRCKCDETCYDGPTGCQTTESTYYNCTGTCTDTADGGCECGGGCTICSFPCTSGVCGSPRSVETYICGSCGGVSVDPGDPGDCFVAETQITMADGSKKNIEDVATGDWIKTINENGVEVFDEVLFPEKTERYGYYRLTLDNGTVLEVTENHPIWARIEDYVGWASLDPLMTKLKEDMVIPKLKVGDYVYSDQKTWLEVMSKQFFPSNLSVYNLRLRGPEHSYFANGVYVHNKGCTNSAPTTPALVSPANNTACFNTNTILLDWNAVVGWGNNCAGNVNSYGVFVNGVKVADVASNITQYNYTPSWSTTNHTWFIRATNGALTKSSATWNFIPASCARITGRIWEDINGNNVYDGAAESWSHNPPPAASCSAFLDNDIAILSPTGGSSVLTSWACNTASYYATSNFPIAGGLGSIGNVQLQLLTPDPIDFPHSYVNWTFNRCSTAGTCTPYAGVTSGTNTNIANVGITNINGAAWSNWVNWQISRNQPPRATITTSVAAGRTFVVNGQTAHVVPVGTPQPFTANAVETRASLPWNLSIARRPFNPTTRVAPTDLASNFVLGANNACSGLNCTATFSDAAVPAGYSVYHPVSQDEIAVSTGIGRVSNQCSGHPGVNSGALVGWGDCDTVWGDGYQDEAVVFGDRIPTCNGITGPSQMFAYVASEPYVYPESVGWFNMRVRDLDRTEVKHSLTPGWTNVDGVFPTITQVRIYAAGTTSQGVGPRMQLWLGNNASGGARGVSPTWQATVSNIYPTYAPFTINGPFNNVSSMQIGFANDANVSGDRNLYIQRVEVTYEVRPGNSLVKTLLPYTMPGHGAVYYDRGVSVAAPYNNHGSWFDGADIDAAGTLSQEVTAAGAYGSPAGTMNLSGTLSFPIPLRSSATGGALALDGTPLSSLPYYDGLSCSSPAITNDDSPEYTITGTIYLRNASLTCPVQNISTAPKVTGTGVNLRDGAGNVIPGYTATTDGSGRYTFSGVPVFYRPDPFCATCGAYVCLDQMAADVGVYIAACSQIQPPASAPNSAWADSSLCSPIISTTPQITDGTVATVNLGFDYYQNEKWSTVLDGDTYSPGMTFDIPTVPGTNFAPYFINRRIDSGGNATIGGFAFVDDADVDLGLPLTRANLSEHGGYARALRNAANTYNFKDKWLVNFTPVAPTHADVLNNADPRDGNHYRFDASKVYVYNRDQFNNWYNDITIPRYDVTGAEKLAIVYVIGDVAAGETLNLNRPVRTSAEGEMLILITNLPVEIADTLEVNETQLTGNTYNVNSFSIGSGANLLSEGYIDFVILSTGDIEFDSRYDDTVDPNVYDLPIAIYGALISKGSVILNKDLWHIYNSDYPAEMVRYYPTLVPDLLDSEEQDSDLQSFTGLGVFDIQTVYE